MSKIIGGIVFLFAATSIFAQNTIDSLVQVISASEVPAVKSKSYIEITNLLRTTDTLLFKKYISEGFAYSRKINDRETEFQLAFNHCKFLYAQNQYEKLRSYTDSIIPLVEKEGMFLLLSNIYNYRATSYSNTSNYPKAIEEFFNFFNSSSKIIARKQKTSRHSNQQYWDGFLKYGTL